MELPLWLTGMLPAPIAERLRHGDFSRLDSEDEWPLLFDWMPRNRKKIPKPLRMIFEVWLSQNRLKKGAGGREPVVLTDAQREVNRAWLAGQFGTWLESGASHQAPKLTLAGEPPPGTPAHFDASLPHFEIRLKKWRGGGEWLTQRLRDQYSALWGLRSEIAAVLAFEIGEGVLETVDEAEALNWTGEVEGAILGLQWKVRDARARLIWTEYDVPDQWLVADVRLFIEHKFWRRPPCGQCVGEWVVTVSGPEDRKGLERVLREIDAAVLRMRNIPEPKADAKGASAVKMPNRFRLAYDDLLLADRALAEQSVGARTDKACYGWLAKRKEGKQLLDLKTWIRYVGGARHFLGEQKNTPRLGRVGPDQYPVRVEDIKRADADQ